MFHHVDDALEALLRADEPMLADATISFDDLNDDEPHPDLRVHLWRVNVSAKGASSGSEVIERDGVKVRRQRLPNVELSYALTAHSPDARDQHRVLAAALRTFLRHAAVPEPLVPTPLVESGSAVSLRVPKLDADDLPGQDGQQASIDLRVTVAIDLEREETLADAPGSTDFGFEDRRSGAVATRRRYAGEVTDPAAAGVDVLGPAGAATVDQDGRFVIVARPGDRIAVMVDPPVTVVVPESGKILVD